MTNPKLKGYVEVNTVNTSLSSEYDFGIHLLGCPLLKRGKNSTCQQHAHYAFSPQELIDEIREDLARYFGESAEDFTFKIFPCATAVDKQEG